MNSGFKKKSAKIQANSRIAKSQDIQQTDHFHFATKLHPLYATFATEN